MRLRQTAAPYKPKGCLVRKVRASQSRITDNVRRRRLPGKCNRNKPPEAFLTSIEIGFFTPQAVVTYGNVGKSDQCNDLYRQKRFG